MLADQLLTLTAARSVTARAFTEAEQAQNHCQVGNMGLAINVVQVLTSLQDMTVSTVPRLAAVAVAVLLLMPWMIHRTMSYATDILGNLSRYAH